MLVHHIALRASNLVKQILDVRKTATGIANEGATTILCSFITNTREKMLSYRCNPMETERLTIFMVLQVSHILSFSIWGKLSVA
jgi:hypothetical protein